jgi:hypothetical protein
LFLGGASIPAPKSTTQDEDKTIVLGYRPVGRPTPPPNLEEDSQNRWTIHQQNSWEVIPPALPTKSPRHSAARLPVPNEPSPSTPATSTNTNKRRGLERLRKRLSKSQLSIKTGALASIANLGSPKMPDPIPVNVNAVVLGPSGCGVSTLIRKFVTGSNEVGIICKPNAPQT